MTIFASLGAIAAGLILFLRWRLNRAQRQLGAALAVLDAFNPPRNSAKGALAA